MVDKYKESYKIFKQHTADTLQGSCLWQTEVNNSFRLECWNTRVDYVTNRTELVIYQIWQDGAGYSEYEIRN